MNNPCPEPQTNVNEEMNILKLKRRQYSKNKLIKELLKKAKKDGKSQLQFLDGNKMTRQIETDISKEIRILAEVEKIWIIFDGDGNGTLDKEEIKDYIKFMAEPIVALSDENIDEIFSLIDDDTSGCIDKEEMTIFLKIMMMLQENLTF